MWIERLLSSRTTRALELSAAFAERRHEILTENIANIDVPDYHARRLDPAAFQAALRAALRRAAAANRSRLDLRGNAQFRTAADGTLVVRAARRPAPNVLFHDGTDARLESLLADAAQNGLLYQVATSLLRQQYARLLNAIRGSNA